jgi:ABC-2 type transport system ATP-binding protein
MMTGVTNADTGNIKIDGTDIALEPLIAKKKFGFVPDNPDMFLRLKGIEYLNFMADLYEVKKEQRKELIEKFSKEFEIYDALNDQIQTYSHGMRQKIVLIGALIHNPKVWILDEPLTGLDPKSSFKLKEMMKAHVKNGNVVFFSTHVLEVAEKLCDRIGIINKGKLVFEGTLSQLKSKYKSKENLENIFLEITKDE